MRTPTAVVPRRVVAFLVDGVLLWAASITVFLACAHKVPVDDVSSSSSNLDLTLGDDHWQLEGGKASLFMLIAALVWIAYLGVLPGIRGWTAGKLLVGVRVVNAEGRPPGALKGVLRGVLWIADGFPYFLPGLTGFIVALNTQRHQRIGDQVSGTFVVRAGAVPEAEERPLPAGVAPGPGVGSAVGGQPGTTPPPAPTPPRPAAGGSLFGDPGHSDPFGDGKGHAGAPPVPTPPPLPSSPPAAAAPPAAGTAAPAAPAGWYADPYREQRLRYWDGHNWTSHAAP